jgi:hypothetical protein
MHTGTVNLQIFSKQYFCVSQCWYQAPSDIVLVSGANHAGQCGLALVVQERLGFYARSSVASDNQKLEEEQNIDDNLSLTLIIGPV